MSDITLAHARPAPVAGKHAWGIWASFAWVLGAFIVGFALAIAAVRILALWDASLDLSRVFLDRGLLSLIMLIGIFVTASLVVVLAARKPGWAAVEYLALNRPNGRYLTAGLLCVVLPLLITYVHTVGFQWRSVTVTAPGFFGAGDPTTILTKVAFTAMVAPVTEELVFRGFLYRGLVASRLGAIGTIALTSLLFGVIHVDKSSAGMVDTAIAGVMWGWLRWYTGSLWLPIAAHVANNSTAVLVILIFAAR